VKRNEALFASFTGYRDVKLVFHDKMLYSYCILSNFIHGDGEHIEANQNDGKDYKGAWVQNEGRD